jgi:hypothetical protein
MYGTEEDVSLWSEQRRCGVMQCLCGGGGATGACYVSARVSAAQERQNAVEWGGARGLASVEVHRCDYVWKQRGHVVAQCSLSMELVLLCVCRYAVSELLPGSGNVEGGAAGSAAGGKGPAGRLSAPKRDVPLVPQGKAKAEALIAAGRVSGRFGATQLGHCHRRVPAWLPFASTTLASHSHTSFPFCTVCTPNTFTANTSLQPPPPLLSPAACQPSTHNSSPQPTPHLSFPRLCQQRCSKTTLTVSWPCFDTVLDESAIQSL